MNIAPIPQQEEKNQFIWWSWFRKIGSFCSQLAKNVYTNGEGEVSISSAPIAFTPTCIGNGNQTITTYTATGTYTKTGNLVTYAVEVAITTAGAAANTALKVELPVAANTTQFVFGSGITDNGAPYTIVSVSVQPGFPNSVFVFPNGFYGGVIISGQIIKFSITYPTA